MYCSNNPLNRTDPTGLSDDEVLLSQAASGTLKAISGLVEFGVALSAISASAGTCTPLVARNLAIGLYKVIDGIAMMATAAFGVEYEGLLAEGAEWALNKLGVSEDVINFIQAGIGILENKYGMTSGISSSMTQIDRILSITDNVKNFGEAVYTAYQNSQNREEIVDVLVALNKQFSERENALFLSKEDYDSGNYDPYYWKNFDTMTTLKMERAIFVDDEMGTYVKVKDEQMPESYR